MDGRSLHDLSALVDRVQAAYGHVCFACGRSNELGLHLNLVGVDGDWVVARFQPRPEYVGAPEVVHGGISATALDEILVWAGIVFERVMSVTGRLDLRYRRPIGIGDDVEARGRVVTRSGRRLTVEGTLTVNGSRAAEASGLYLVSAAVEDLPDPRS